MRNNERRVVCGAIFLRARTTLALCPPCAPRTSRRRHRRSRKIASIGNSIESRAAKNNVLLYARPWRPNKPQINRVSVTRKLLILTCSRNKVVTIRNRVYAAGYYLSCSSFRTDLYSPWTYLSLGAYHRRAQKRPSLSIVLSPEAATSREIKSVSVISSEVARLSMEIWKRTKRANFSRKR